jgi:hypothetical protein
MGNSVPEWMGESKHRRLARRPARRPRAASPATEAVRSMRARELKGVKLQEIT